MTTKIITLLMLLAFQPAGDAGTAPATEDQVDGLLVKLYRDRIFDEEQLVKIAPTISKFTADKIWLLGYAVDYKQWSAKKIEEMLPVFLEASDAEIKIRIKVAQEDRSEYRTIAERSEAQRQSQVQSAARTRAQQQANRNWYDRTRYQHYGGMIGLYRSR